MQISRSDGNRAAGLRALCAGLCLLSLLLAPKPALAQTDPDLREIIPFLMLVIDTSGSMERLTSCTCTTPSCDECLPDCSLANTSGGLPPVDALGNDLKKNRWATTLEALTGTINDFQCTPLARTVANGMTYDVGYYLPYNQPWKCNSQLPGTPCDYASTNSAFSQNSNGIIDQYAARVQFGLMSFDGMDTYVGAGPLVPAPPNGFDVNLSNSVQGLWSYGGYKVFHYPNCTTDYAMDTGARSPIATEGSLISLNSCTGVRGSTTCQSWCSLCPGTQDSINQDIQTALIKARPFGGTPIAGALDDLYFHLHQDLTDTFGSCRNRYALLMTDGYPDDDYRSYGCDCQNTQDPSQPNYCGNDPRATEPGLFKCPYRTPEQIASDLIHGRMGTTDKPQIEQLFVVGLAVNDTNVLNRLDAIAHAGCPNATGCDTDHDGHEALFANDLNRLVQNLSAVINGLIHPVSRSVPAFAVGGSAITVSTQQYQVNTGFKVAAETGSPWTGVVERRRFTCDSGVLVENPIDPLTDSFDNILNLRGTPRVLKSVAVGTTVNPEVAMFKGNSTDPCQVSGCSLVDLNQVPPPQLGLGSTDTAGRDLIMDWMYGINGSARVGKRLGDVYHSSAVVLGAPRFDTADEAYNLFRQRTEVANRPLTMFVASNDGILHAFSMEAFTPPTAGTWHPPSYSAGEEMWGFVPPMLLNDLHNNLNTHQFTLDGTAALKTVYFHKDTSSASFNSANTDYHTILVVGMREGGNGYIALDVTDVTAPQFLWQFTDPHMGKTFGQVAIGQATFKDYTNGGSGVTKNGAVVILPGGVGQLGESGLTGDCTNHVSNPQMRQQSTLSRFPTYPDQPIAGASNPVQPFYTRGDVRCWKDVGRALYFVDAENGRLLKKIHADSNGNLVFPSPLVSTPVLYQSDIGTLASRAFLTDADGVIWRVDVSATDQDDDGTHVHPLTGWTARPFHDIFWDKGTNEGELSYEAPVLSTDPSGRLVVIVGTGDTNNFVKPTIENRVVSLTEIFTPRTSPPPTGANPEDYVALINWEKRVKATNGLVPSELVTGTMGLFEGQLFFGTFMAVTGSNACDLGKGRIFAVDYLARDTSDSNGSNPQTYGPMKVPGTALGSDPVATSVINVDATAAVSNFMVMGLGLTERPTCQTLDTADFNVWGQSTYGLQSAGQPSLYLVAQASGDKSTTSVVQQHGGSSLGSVELKLTKKAANARVTSWATSID